MLPRMGSTNKFHHGGKVRAQDIELLKDCVKVGEQEGQPMTALNELLDRVQPDFSGTGGGKC